MGGIMTPGFMHQGAEAVPVDFVVVMLDEIDRLGGNSTELLGRCQLPFPARDLRNGRGRNIALRQFTRIFDECIKEISYLSHRQRHVTPMTRDDVEMLCYCMVSCETLEEVIQRAIKFYVMLGNRGAELALEVDGPEAVFHIRTLRAHQCSGNLLMDLTGLLFFHRFFGWLLNREIPAIRFGVCYGELINAEQLEAVFHQAVHFGEATNNFHFPADFLKYPVVRNYQRLREILGTLPLDMMPSPAMSWRLSDAVEKVISAHLAKEEAIPTMQELAGLFSISVTTFRRRLEEENSPLKVIKERCRLKLAVELLASPARLKIEDVAQRLGFSDASGFRRAFKTWAGVPPDNYRTPASSREASSGFGSVAGGPGSPSGRPVSGGC
ncbi:conserved protein of unknown function [Denitratisoma oestradiolicum]|uniref:HTH araC/xylS-type domain-containing protein n=2 Tax=Denitratisoma oestradiolicum TaxID=311182 RepID=A0A6S6YDB2_9PROT|nr:conserved protein of unknown function [Denitratisoma oestradiolicum]